MNNCISFTLHSLSGTREFNMPYQNLFAIGYAGRNIEKTLEHIRELEVELGVPAPKKIPTIFQCSNLLLTQDNSFHVLGERTCGEVEYIIIRCDGGTYIGVGSDHTDRDLESASVPKAKQVCPKPIGGEIWDYEELRDHWDEIEICSYQTVNGTEVLYQKGTLADILPVETILKELEERVGDIGNSIIFSGTVPALNGFKFGSSFRGEMKDRKLGRTITCTYHVAVISEEER
ncbi:MAG TPA: DUF2848 family protein [Clostridia bacterium]|nr:DUF2848 family protein [Clostridia bacterium]